MSTGIRIDGGSIGTFVCADNKFVGLEKAVLIANAQIRDLQISGNSIVSAENSAATAVHDSERVQVKTTPETFVFRDLSPHGECDMSIFDDARALVLHAEEDLKKLENDYNVSLHEKTVKPALLIDIKNLMENLRSALDYLAHALFAKYGRSLRAKPKIYFPYAKADQTLLVFQASKRIERSIPGIESHQKVVRALESVQHFADEKFAWLPKFMELNNETKHQRLSPQTRTETKQLTMSSGGASMSLGQGAGMTLGRGASIQIGSLLIPGGQLIDTNNPPKTTGSGTVEIITWVSFVFSDTREPVLPFLKSAVDGTRAIVDRLSGL